MCQSLFSVGDIFQQLNDANNIRTIKAHFVLLLDEVCCCCVNVIVVV